MKFQLLTAIVAGAALTQVGASPLRVVVVTSHQELPATPNLRFGHALADSHVAKLSLPTAQPINFMNSQAGSRRPCGQRIKDKAIKISNSFRHALGLPLIESGHPKPGDHIHGGMVHIMPFVGTPSMVIKQGTHVVGEVHGSQVKSGNSHRFHAHKFHEWGTTFSMRIHNALMALGPWEGRAVAFVLGCGIGVLARMFWVLTVVAYRSTCGGERDDEYTHVAVIEEYGDAEDIAVPPPTYTIVDEKDQVKVKDTKDAAEN